MVHACLDASIGKQELFGWPMCQVEISGWPASQLRPEEPVTAAGSRLSLSRADPQDARRVPPRSTAAAVYQHDILAYEQRPDDQTLAEALVESRS